ncbi:hypothetical protein EDD15DRAFT_1019338 [Pisolithus albus]|nr:hypothetical protein EDD15DRAFT_1019338 [Pisolithus albus]
MLSLCKTHSKVGYHSVRRPSLCTITTTRIDSISSRNKPKPADCGICIKVVAQVTLRTLNGHSPCSTRHYLLTGSSNHAERTHVAPKDSPPRPKQTSAGYRSGHLNLVRIAVLRDLGRISSVALEYLKSAARPFLPQQIDVAEIKESLQRDGTVCSGDSRRNESPTSERSNFNCRDVYLLLMDKKSIDVHGGKKTHWN